MAKFRQSNTRQGGKSNNSWFTRMVLFTVLLIIATVFFTIKISDWMGGDSAGGAVPSTVDGGSRFYLPSGGTSGQIIHHDYYSLSYNEQYEQANWVAYELTKSSLKAKNVPREKKFRPDYSVKSRSAYHSDYTHSGYTRGHMAPAGDMAFDQAAMEQCFYMSNMSPQIRPFNNGIWKELEELVRDWAYDNDRLYIVTGPILDNVDQKIGKNKIGVPKQFFKVLLDVDGNEKKGIGYIIPHEKSDKSLASYAMSIDQVEQITGFDLFPDMIDDNEAMQLEANYDQNLWPLDDNKFKQRVNSWNNQ